MGKDIPCQASPKSFGRRQPARVKPPVSRFTATTEGWEAHGLDANSYYTIALSNGQQFDVETDSTGSFTTTQTLTIDGGTTQTFTFTGPLLGTQTTIYSFQVPYGSC